MIPLIHTLSEGFEFWHEASDSWHPARVPGCIHTDLERAGLIPAPFYGCNEQQLQWIENRDWTYRCRFELSEALLAAAHQRIEFDGLDTLARVTLNGHLLGESENMFHAVAYDVGGIVRPGTNELVVVFKNTIDWIRARCDWQPFPERNDPVGGRSRIRKAQYHYSWDWGPRFVTCGIWRPVRLVGWTGERLSDFRIDQTHQADGVTLRVAAEVSSNAPGSRRIRAEVALGDQVLDTAEGTTDGGVRLVVANPRLWWPAGQGAQPLYLVTVRLLDGDGQVVDTRTNRIGLRVIECVRESDSEGESFYFRVNGRPIFSKGANWIPDHMFVTECTRERLRERLESAVEANMNMIRVWGGGVYESEDFYDLCDERGLLVWQDFMFACALYPGNDAFCRLLRSEAEYQVRRLRHHACLALWCGNNEIPLMALYGDEMKRDAASAANYARVFHRLLPDVVAAHDGSTAYWPSSPWTPEGLSAGPNSGRGGDVHFWDVWHARAPVAAYQGLHLRFCSEFGMQSYASLESALSFCPPDELNVFSRTMENHQKNGGGNATMLHYMAKRYRLPEGYPHLAYVSQLSQAYCMKIGVEHFRHQQTYTMGALYWQLNDVWPVASWSSIEFGGHWKALHHAARRFFAPVLLYARADGAVEVGHYNAIKEAIRGFSLHVVSDAPEASSGTWSWSVRGLDGTCLGEETCGRVDICHGQAEQIAYAPYFEGVDRSRSYLRAELTSGAGDLVSAQNVFFTEPRFLALEDPAITWELEPCGDREYALTLRARSFAHAVALDLPMAFKPWYSDNWFDLHAGEPRMILLRSRARVSLEEIRERLCLTSLWHSYQPVFAIRGLS